jgi:outer membrane protein TolC
VLLTAISGWAAAQEAPPAIDPMAGSAVLDLPQVIALALERNPAIEIARQDVQQARARLPQANSWDDPMLGVNAWPFDPAVPQTAGGRMRAEVMLSQKVPWRGKIRTREDIAFSELTAAEFRLRQMELQVAQQVTEAFLAHWGSRVQARLWQQDVQLLQELEQVIQALYQTGRVGQQDALQTAAEIGLTRGQWALAEEQVIANDATLRQILHWPRAETLQLTDQLPPAPTLEPLETLVDQALVNRPELQEIQAQVQGDLAQIEQARLDYYPDLNFRLGWGEMTTQGAIAPFADGIDSITTGVELNLPVRRARRAAAVSEAESRLVATSQRLEQQRDETLRQIRQVHAEIERVNTQLDLYQTQIVPPMEQAWQVTLQGYQVSQATFNDLINIRRQLIRLRQAETDLTVQLHASHAKLERLVSTPR